MTTDTLPKKAEKNPNLKGGSRKGIPNKATGELKAMILQALENQGGVQYLETQAVANPGAFMSLIGKVLPMTLVGAGEGGSHIVNVNVKFR